MATAEEVFAPPHASTGSAGGYGSRGLGGAVLPATVGKSIFAQALALAVAAGISGGDRHPVQTRPDRSPDWEQGQYMTNLRYQRLSLGMGRTSSAGAESPRSAVPSPCRAFSGLRLTKRGAERSSPEDRGGPASSSLTACALLVRRWTRELQRDPPALDMLNALADRTGCVPVVIHHAKKRQEGMSNDLRTVVRGKNSAIFDAAASVYVFAAKEGEPVLVSTSRSGSDDRCGRSAFSSRATTTTARCASASRQTESSAISRARTRPRPPRTDPRHTP